jgi:archaeal flagellin N-terminal-like domain
MFKRLIPDTDGRGQVGIGTLIIFIALVLVAAVAAGVLTNTAGELQTRAADTGDDAQAEVSNQIDVVSSTGAVTGSNDEIKNVTLVVKKSPGSDPVDLSETTIEYTSESDSETLADESGFEIKQTDGTTDASDTVLDDTSERKKIVITLDGTGSKPSALGEGEDATLEIVDQSGASTVHGVNVPDVLTGSFVEV